ncbi:MAG: hypothetical protein KatS3mg131_3671 [Candidatus Tectimicrobiota bacterium]|nr:MAG: hypothetical protein KatS3mg131_3671 [Candidatus Tectomicrobia bacterium]
MSQPRIGGMAQEHEYLVSQLLSGQTIPDALNAVNRLLVAFRDTFNQDYSPRYLLKLTTEVVPTHPRDVAVVRARMGTLIEFALAVSWNEAAKSSRNAGWRVSMNYVTEYPNLYLRDDRGTIRLRLETKCLHDEADEGAARFDVLTPLIDRSMDVLVVVGWKWVSSGSIVYPSIIIAEAFSAYELAVRA